MTPENVCTVSAAQDMSGLSGIVLAGGRSRRMGKNKAELLLMGKTLLQLQVDKLRALGVEDILISGGGSLPGARTVPDEYHDRGPLGGLHACLKAAQNPCALVLGVDIPLVPPALLKRLWGEHRGGITVVEHSGGMEPLIGIYDCSLWQVIESLIQEKGAPVRALQAAAQWRTVFYEGPKEYLNNCNCPEDFACICRVAENAAALGIM